MVIDLSGELGRVERHLVEQPLHDRVQPARADVLGPLVDEGRELGDRRDAFVGERQVDAFGRHQRHVLLDQRAPRLGEDAHELGLAERVELDADREAALQLRNQIRRLRDVERAGGDEQDVVGADHAVLGVDGGAFDDRQDVALHAFAADVRAVAAFAAGDLVDLVDEDDARLLHPLDGRGGHRVHVDQLLLFFARAAARAPRPPARGARFERPWKKPGIMSFRLRPTSSIDEPGDQLERRDRLFLDVDLDDAVVELAGAQLLAHALARAAHLVADRGRDPRPARPAAAAAADRAAAPRLLLRLGAHVLERSSRTMSTASSTRSRTIDSTSRPT